MAKRNPKPIKPEKKFLVVQYDVTDLTEEQIGELALETQAQAEQSDGHPSVQVVESKTIDANVDVICSRCGSPNVSYAIWHHPNHPILDREGECFGSWNYGDNSFCDDCEHDDLLDRGTNPQRFDTLRAKYARKNKEG